MNAPTQSPLEKMCEQAYKPIRLVRAAQLIAERFTTAAEEEFAVAEVLRHATEELEALFTLIAEAVDAEKVKPATT